MEGNEDLTTSIIRQLEAKPELIVCISSDVYTFKELEFTRTVTRYNGCSLISTQVSPIKLYYAAIDQHIRYNLLGEK